MRTSHTCHLAVCTPKTMKGVAVQSPCISSRGSSLITPALLRYEYAFGSSFDTCLEVELTVIIFRMETMKSNKEGIKLHRGGYIYTR